MPNFHIHTKYLFGYDESRMRKMQSGERIMRISLSALVFLHNYAISIDSNCPINKFYSFIIFCSLINAVILLLNCLVLILNFDIPGTFSLS